MKVISVFDLKRISALSHLTIFDMVNPKYDHLVNPWLHVLGFDLSKGLSYAANLHRTRTGEVAVGYVIRGEVRIDEQFLRSPFATLEDKIAAAARTNKSLAYELCSMLNQPSSIGMYSDGAEGEAAADFPDSLRNPDEETILIQIKQLEALLYDIRGEQHGEDGALKKPEDYQKTEVPVKVRRKKRIKEA